jgi:hypothetical protein
MRRGLADGRTAKLEDRGFAPVLQRGEPLCGKIVLRLKDPWPLG